MEIKAKCQHCNKITKMWYRGVNEKPLKNLRCSECFQITEMKVEF